MNNFKVTQIKTKQHVKYWCKLQANISIICQKRGLSKNDTRQKIKRNKNPDKVLKFFIKIP